MSFSLPLVPISRSTYFLYYCPAPIGELRDEPCDQAAYAFSWRTNHREAVIFNPIFRLYHGHRMNYKKIVFCQSDVVRLDV